MRGYEAISPQRAQRRSPLAWAGHRRRRRRRGPEARLILAWAEPSPASQWHSAQEAQATFPQPLPLRGRRGGNGEGVDVSRLHALYPTQSWERGAVSGRRFGTSVSGALLRMRFRRVQVKKKGQGPGLISPGCKAMTSTPILPAPTRARPPVNLGESPLFRDYVLPVPARLSISPRESAGMIGPLSWRSLSGPRSWNGPNMDTAKTHTRLRAPLLRAPPSNAQTLPHVRLDSENVCLSRECSPCWIEFSLFQEGHQLV